MPKKRAVTLEARSNLIRQKAAGALNAVRWGSLKTYRSCGSVPQKPDIQKNGLYLRTADAPPGAPCLSYGRK